MLKKLICAGAAVLILGAGAICASAAENQGEILVWMRCGEKVVTDGSLEIYRAGDPVPEGYLLGEEFGGGVIAGVDIPSPAFALWMSERAGPGTIGHVDEEGLVRFPNLEPGMYLIRQGEPSENYIPIEPFLACVSEELSRVDTYPEVLPEERIPKTAESPETYLGVLGICGALTGLIYALDPRRSRKNTIS